MKIQLFILPIIIALNSCIQAQSTITQQKPDAFQESMKEKSILLDVRTPEEYKNGHIPGAINKNIYAENFKKEVLNFDKSKKILVYCAVGGRSHAAAQYLVEKGYEVIELQGGFNSWKSKGMPTE